MKQVAFILILLSHGTAALSFVIAVHRGRMPRVVDFACLSALIYYDSGLIAELVGSHDSDFFPALIEVEDERFIFAALLLLVLPWILRFGASLVHPRLILSDPDTEAEQVLSPPRRVVFYWGMGLVAILAAAAGARAVFSADVLWVARSEIGTAFGPYVIVLYSPLFILGFFITLRDARSRPGLVFTLFLLATSILATIGLAERTLLLLPIVIVVLFRQRLSLGRLAALAAAGFFAAAALLPFFKWQYSDSDLSLTELAAGVASADFDRAAVLAKAVELSPMAGSQVLPYPMEGYVYALALYIPRSLFPEKGYSTAIYFTSAVVGTTPEATDWGFGVGMLEETVLNAGILFSLPLLLLLGVGLGSLERFSHSVPGIVPATRLAGLFACGYNITAVQLIYGSMIIAGWVLQRIFVNAARHRPWSQHGTIARMNQVNRARRYSQSRSTARQLP